MKYLPAPTIPSLLLGVASVMVLQIAQVVGVVNPAYVEPAAYFSLVFFMWRISKKQKELTDMMFLYRMEHEVLISWYEKTTGMTRPATSMAKAKSVGM